MNPMPVIFLFSFSVLFVVRCSRLLVVVVDSVVMKNGRITLKLVANRRKQTDFVKCVTGSPSQR